MITSGEEGEGSGGVITSGEDDGGMTTSVEESAEKVACGGDVTTVEEGDGSILVTGGGMVTRSAQTPRSKSWGISKEGIP